MASVSSGVCFAAIASFGQILLNVFISVVTNQNKKAVLLAGVLHIWNEHMRNIQRTSQIGKRTIQQHLTF